jgi:hypothetical protein
VGCQHPTAYRGLASTTDKANRLDNRPVGTGATTIQKKSPTIRSTAEGHDIEIQETKQKIDNGATEPVDTMPASSGGRASTTKNGTSQEADDDGCPAEWHAGTNRKRI